VINIVVDHHLRLGVMKAMKPPGILRQRASPGNRHCQEERVEARVTRALTDEGVRKELPPPNGICRDTILAKRNGIIYFGEET